MPDIDSLHREEDASNGMAIANGALIAPDADVSSALTTQVDQQTFQRVVEENVSIAIFWIVFQRQKEQ